MNVVAKIYQRLRESRPLSEKPFASIHQQDKVLQFPASRLELHLTKAMSVKTLIPMTCLLLLGQSCVRKPSETEVSSNSNDTSDLFFGSFQKTSEDSLILIATKYEVSDSDARKIAETYLKNHDMLYALLGETNGQDQPGLEEIVENSVSETISQLSKEMNIPRQTIASVIIDYRILKALESFPEQ